jgi:hypothetical protein
MPRLHSLPLLVQAQRALLRARGRVRREPTGDIMAPPPSGAASPPPPPLDTDQLRTARRIERAVLRAGRRGLFRPLCLVRALAIQSMLEDHGIGGGRVRLGVRLEDGKFQAHAWVQRGDLVLGDDEANINRYVPLEGGEVTPLR